ncbi:unnamed protein product [Amoebophrya sp. A25]|nr:unnamed protein product [Amoebophrya sp. A25]|eukprot:GSA25T00003105001.1
MSSGVWRLFSDDEAFSGGELLTQRRPRPKILEGSDNKGPPRGLLTLQLLLLFSDSLRYIFVIETFVSLLAKFAIFPDSSSLKETRLAEELVCLIFFALLEGWRLDFGYDGNQTERTSRLAVFNAFSAVQILIVGFFFTKQVYVLRIDAFVSGSVLCATILQVVITIPAAARMGIFVPSEDKKDLSSSPQDSGSPPAHRPYQVGGNLEVWLSAGACVFSTFIVFVVY